MGFIIAREYFYLFYYNWNGIAMPWFTSTK